MINKKTLDDLLKMEGTHAGAKKLEDISKTDIHNKEQILTKKEVGNYISQNYKKSLEKYEIPSNASLEIVYAPTRKDVAAVKLSAFAGFYWVVWKDKKGEIHSSEPCWSPTGIMFASLDEIAESKENVVCIFRHDYTRDKYMIAKISKKLLVNQYQKDG